jgi:hypothetical protein
MLGAHYQDHAPSFIKEVPGQIFQECPGWVHGPLKSHPCDCRDSVQAILWQFVEGEMGVRGGPENQKKTSQQT